MIRREPWMVARPASSYTRAAFWSTHGPKAGRHYNTRAEGWSPEVLLPRITCSNLA